MPKRDFAIEWIASPRVRLGLLFLLVASGCVPAVKPEPELASLSVAPAGSGRSTVVKLYSTRISVERTNQTGTAVLFAADLTADQSKDLNARIERLRSANLDDSYAGMIEDGTVWDFRSYRNGVQVWFVVISNYYGPELRELAQYSDSIDALLPKQYRIHYGEAARARTRLTTQPG